jgi:hypothetical protein
MFSRCGSSSLDRLSQSVMSQKWLHIVGNTLGSTTLIPQTYRTLFFSCVEFHMMFSILFRWCETMSLRNWTASRPIVSPLDDMCMEHRWNDVDWGKPKDWKKILSQLHLSTTDPTWTAVEVNRDPRDGNPASNHPCCGTASSMTSSSVATNVLATR